ncbi:MAG: hypothetical protein Tsb002_28540 [Wenzhouxiangellaceae bacterium]
MPLLLIAMLILITTARHEGAHALAAWLQGVPLIEVRLWPGWSDDVGFYFGYVIRGDGGNWLIDAAPFIAALLWALLAYLILRQWPVHRRYRQAALWLGLFSPVFDLAYNYQGGFWRRGADVADLFAALPDPAVHGYFLGAIALCVFLIHHTRQLQQADLSNA